MTDGNKIYAYACIPCKRVFERGEHVDRHPLQRLEEHIRAQHADYSEYDQGVPPLTDCLSGEDIAVIYDPNDPWGFLDVT